MDGASPPIAIAVLGHTHTLNRLPFDDFCVRYARKLRSRDVSITSARENNKENDNKHDG